MLPFTDIDFFLFAIMYVAIIMLTVYLTGNKFYVPVTAILTALYLVFYYKYSFVAFGFFACSYIFIRYIVLKINHKLVSSIILAIPMLLVKVHFNPSFFYFAGLSFVTFRAIQVSIDYTKDDKLHLVHYFNFLFFIPSLYIGPLDRYNRFTKNCLEEKNIVSNMFINGLDKMIKGILYKFIIAEFILRYWLHNTNQPLLFNEKVSDVYAYTFYLFFDFAGYSAMAVGMSNLLGIDLPFNFNKPFIAVNPQDFWQRWHASLSNWLTDYFFKPLYKWLGSFKKLKSFPITKQNLAIFFTLFVMGIWNGFEPHFIWSGIIYGTYSVFHNIYTIRCRQKDKDVIFGKLSPIVVKYMSIIFMFHAACVALYVFSGR